MRAKSLRLQQAISAQLGRLLGERNLDVIFSAGPAEAATGRVSTEIALSPLVGLEAY